MGINNNLIIQYGHDAGEYASWCATFPISFTSTPVLVGGGLWINGMAVQNMVVGLTGFTSYCVVRECRLNATWIVIGT